MKNKYEIRGDKTAIYIKCNNELKETIISTAVLPKMNDFSGTWFGWYSKTTGGYYVVGKHMGKKISLHRFILNASPDMVVDHEDRDSLNNTSNNLREVTQPQNSQNTRREKKTVSGHRGVAFNKNNKTWIVRVSYNKQRIFLGSFKELDDAIRASIEGRAKLMPFSQDAKENSNVNSDLFENRKKAKNSNKSSGLRFISWAKDRNKWFVYLYIKGKSHRIGYFEDLEIAKEKLKDAKKFYNFIEVAM